MQALLILMNILMLLISGCDKTSKTTKAFKALPEPPKTSTSRLSTDAKRIASKANKIRTKLVLLNNCSNGKKTDEAPRNIAKGVCFEQKIRQINDSLMVDFKVKDACCQRHRSFPAPINKDSIWLEFSLIDSESLCECYCAYHYQLQVDLKGASVEHIFLQGQQL